MNKPFPSMYGHYQCDPITRQAGWYANRVAFRNAGVEPEDIDVTGCYDAFTFTPVLLFEGYGFCGPGEGGDYVSSGVINLGGARPNNTSGGQLCEGYTHGMSLVIENVRQLRHQADDSCPGWASGQHTYDYAVGGCRQVPEAELAMNMGWGTPAVSSALDPREVGVSAEYMHLILDVQSTDSEHRGYYELARQGKLVVQRCTTCGLLRGVIGAACPYCTSGGWAWQEVSGRGTVYSYEIVTQAIQPAFADWVPYPVVLVELDEQRMIPWRWGLEDETVSVRLITNLVRARRPDPARIRVQGGHRPSGAGLLREPDRRLRPAAVQPVVRAARARALAGRVTAARPARATHQEDP